MHVYRLRPDGGEIPAPQLAGTLKRIPYRTRFEELSQQVAFELIVLWHVELGTLGRKALVIDRWHFHNDIKQLDGRCCLIAVMQQWESVKWSSLRSYMKERTRRGERADL